ncbi:hypothetical protein [Methylobacterium gnaphalii]|uniref:Uncharacterized protein n=1 Tax=Methylobacterium gnaphalii TaxID=1010610 RepID=A0A512JQK0_9HYPH|nr:hypothetical protein [Methylobacterium gnaphalii]GEP12236.1 hypothetical protein MGN01_40810 [Methylobacterium gnaphalii]GJD70556.1 hypothetical protein MMMDOFMJ_3505 [Methylobacterium gnaphalii]GLS48525.1 hypothetical protein GCM10007885_13690 [Methylobacterium gnaphalii]
MARMVSADFTTRRDAEMAVEHIVQEHGVDRKAVTVGPSSEENTAGTEAARADVVDGHLKKDTVGKPALAGKVRVSVQISEPDADKVRSSFRTFGGEPS